MLRIITFTRQGCVQAKAVADAIPSRLYRKFHMDDAVHAVSRDTVQHNAIQNNAVQNNAVQHNAIQNNAVQNNEAQNNAVQKNAAAGDSASMDDIVNFHPVTEALSDWASEGFEAKDPLLFIGAAGIAVRAIAGSLRNKLTDVPVLVMDMEGKFVIPILSGHYGGANALANQIAEVTGAAAVITTATDQVGAFAADLFARKHGMRIRNPKALPYVSGRAVAGETIRISWEEYIHPEDFEDDTKDGAGHDTKDGAGHDTKDGAGHDTNHITSADTDQDSSFRAGIPEYIRDCLDRLHGRAGNPAGTREVGAAEPADIRITIRPLGQEELADTGTLYLTPAIFHAGIGCKKGVPAERMEGFVRSVCEFEGIDIHALAGIASIDVKKEEPAILALAETLGIPFVTYSAEELGAVEGHFPESPFVERQVGVGEVSGRAAARLAGPGYQMYLKKIIRWGITFSLAVSDSGSAG